MTNPVTHKLPPKPILKPHMKALREQGVVLTRMGESDKSEEEIMDMIVDIVYKGHEEILNTLTGGELMKLASACIELTYGDEIEKK